MTTDADARAGEEQRWRARPVLAGALRCALLAIPLVASTGAALLVGRLLPAGSQRSFSGLAALLVTAVVVAIGVERAARRLLPIALLLKLSMIFPDRAPSRLKLARAAAGRQPSTELLFNGPGAEPLSTSDLVLNLVAALGSHDRRTRGHSERVRLLCDMLAEELKLDQGARDRLRWSALLHDVGKMRVSPAILNKPSRLDAREFDRIRQHPAAGAELAGPLLPWLGEWGAGILDHHEKYDGSGYPSGKAGSEISAAGRLIGLIDAFETMTAARPYKKAMATKAAREELARCAGTHFDPAMVRAFLSISLPRVLWAMGPLSFLFQLPFLRPLADAGVRTGAAVPQAAATALATGAAGAAVLVGGLAPGTAVTGSAEMTAGGAGAGPTAQQLLPEAVPDGSSAGGRPAPPPAAESPAPAPQAAAAAADVPRPGAPRSTGSRPRMPAPNLAPAPADDPPAPGAPAAVPPAPDDAAAPAPGTAPAAPAEPEAPEPAAPEPAAAEPAAAAPAAPEPAAAEPVESGTVSSEPAPPAPAAAAPDAAPDAAPEPPAAPAEPAAPPPVQTHPAVLSGPRTTPLTTATFVLAPGTWECQVPGTKAASVPRTCEGTYVVEVPGDGSYTLKIKDPSSGAFLPDWSWTVDSALVSARAVGSVLLLDGPVVAAPPAGTDTAASPDATSASPGFSLMAALVALVLPVAAAARRLRSRRP